MKDGTGTLVLGIYLAQGLTSTSTYTGGTTVKGGTLQIAFDGALGASTGNITAIGTIAAAGPVTFDGGTIAVADPFLQYAGNTGETTLTWSSDRHISVTANGGTIGTPTFSALDAASIGHSIVASVVLTGVGGYNWGGPLQLQGDVGSNMSINGGTGAVSVQPGASIAIGSNVSLSAGGSNDPFTDSLNNTQHVAIVDNGFFSVAPGSAVQVAGLAGGGTVTIPATASLISDGIRVSSLTINGSVSLRQGAGNAGTSVLSSLPTIAGKFDLTDNKLIVQTTGATGNKASVISALQTLVTQGNNGGSWTGGGITSSTVANDVTTATAHAYHTTLAIADNGALATPFTTFGGTVVSPNSILATRALVGDGDLNNTVNNADLVVLFNHFGASGATQTSGDYDGNGTVNNADLVALFNDFGQSMPGGFSVIPTAGKSGATSASVPEPASLAVLALGGAALLTRRRRKVVQI